MAAPRQRSAREEKERTRVYQARLALHRGQLRRRNRDNLIAGVAGGVLILAVVGGQIAFFTVGPGVPAPSPAPSEPSTPTAPPLPIPAPVPTTTQ